MSSVLASALLGGSALALAWRLRWLTPGGLRAALAVGLAVFAGAGLPGLVLLLFFFVSASLLTRLGGAAKAAPGPEHGEPAPARPPDERGGRDRRGRRAGQVLANGGAAALAALAGVVGWEPGAHYALAAALAAATADTWATEVGTLARGTTRLLTTWEEVPPGTSGGVSWAGTVAGLAGAGALGLAAGLLLAVEWVSGVDPSPGSVTGWVGVALTAGSVGMAVDSLLGAAVEERVRWVDNDVVNLGGTLAGAVAGLAAACLLGP